MNPQQGGNTSGSSGFLLGIIVVAVIVMLVWYFFPQWIIYPVFFVRLGEVHFVHLILSLWSDLISLFGFSQLDLSYYSKISHYLMDFLAHPKALHYKVFGAINAEIGGWMRYFFVPIMLSLAYCIYRYSKVLHFKKSYSMNGLKKAEVENWPKITPVATIDLVKEDIRKGPWAMAQTPLEFCQSHNLIFPKKNLEYMVWGLNRSSAFRILSLQLGPQLQNLLSLPIHIKALIVIFVFRVIDKTKQSNAFLAQIASSASSGKLDFAGIEEAFLSIKDHRVITWTQDRHAYVYSFMATLLEIARSDGVLASSEFLWLKPLDRNLWYVLNSVGRQTAVVEVAGTYAHWLAEKKVARALKTPMIKEAVNALELAMEDVLYEEEGLTWHSSAG